MDPDPRHDAAHHRTLASAVRATGLVTLLSRVGGLARDVLVGRIFGDTPIGSAFAAGFLVPNVFRRLLGEGALSAAFIPEYACADRDDPAAARRFASLIVLLLAIVTGALTAAIEVALLLVLRLGSLDADARLSVALIMTMLPFMPLVCLTAVLAGMLQVHGRFGAAASGPIILNAFIIAAGLWHLASGTLGTTGTAYLLGAATVLSGLTQTATFAWLLRKHVRWTRVFGDARARARRTLRAFTPVFIGLGTIQLASLGDLLIAMWPIWVGGTVLGAAYPLDKGSNIILSLTQRLYQFPLGVFGIAVASAAFPLLSRHADEPTQFASTLRRGLRLSFFIGAPASVGLVMVRHDLTAVMFGGGSHAFSPEGLERSAAVLLGYAPAVWAYSLNHVLTRAFYARKDTRTPMRVSLATVALGTALSLGLIWIAREAGLAWSTAITACVQCGVLIRLAKRRLGVDPLGAECLASFVRLAAATAAMALAVAALHALWPEPAGWTMRLGRLAAGVGIGGGVYLGLARAARVPELAWLLERSPRGGEARVDSPPP